MKNFRKLTLALIPLTMLTMGCTQKVVNTGIPYLPPAPKEAVDALKKANDPVVDYWVILLNKFYDKQEVVFQKVKN